jgi:AcrR family transcriptional regulator
MDLKAGRGPTGGTVTADQEKTAVALSRMVEHYRFPEGYRRMFLAAIAAFSERGFHGTSTRDIAARAGMSPAALYVHFGSKEEVLYRIAISAVGLTQDVMTTADTEAAGSPTGRLRAVVRAITAWHAHHAAAARVVLYQLDALTPDHRAEVLELERAIDQIIRRIVDAGIESGEFSMADPGLAGTAVLSLCMDVARWYHPHHRRSPEDIGEQYAEAALRVVGASSPAA